MMPQKEELPTIQDILDAALEYADNGYSVIPVRREDKRPYIKWEEFQHRIATREEIEEWWSQYPRANVAIVCGKVSKDLMVVDGDGPIGVKWINDNLPPTGVYSDTYKGIHALYWGPENCVIRNRVRLAPEVDIRGEGGYFVAPPSIHASGHVYRWRLTTGWDDISVYVPPNSEKTLNLDLSSVKSQVSLVPVDQGCRNQTLAQLCGRWCAKDLNYEEVFGLARDWNNKNNPPLGTSELERTVQSIFVTHKRNHPPQEDDPSIERYIPPPLVSSEFPARLLKPGGLLGMLMEYIASNSVVNIPMFDLAAAMPLVGSLVGQKVMTETGLRTNLYVISLGYSGTGKNAPLNAISELVSKTNAFPLLGPSTVTSDSSLLRRLTVQGKQSTLMLLDEFGHVLKGIKKPLSVEAKIPALLTKLFSGTQRGESKEYATGEVLQVAWHHVSFYATSTPGRFWEDLNPKDFADGFLARANVFQTRNPAPEPRPLINSSISDALIDAIKDLYGLEMQMDQRCGNMPMYARPLPRIIKASKDAKAELKPFQQKCLELQNETREAEDGISAVYARAAEHAAKFALIKAVSTYGADIVNKKISAEDMRWAIDVISYLTDNTITQIKENLAENEIDSLQKRILRVIRAKATEDRPGVSMRDLHQALPGITRRQMAELLETLFEAGRIMVDSEWKPKAGFAPKGGLICLSQLKKVDKS